MDSHPQFGNYEILERIAVGGMAEVYKAKVHGVEGFERVVAIKRILPHLLEEERFLRMFVDEAQIAVSLTHPHIVQIYELGTSNGRYYITMEYVPGKNLAFLLRILRAAKAVMPLQAACYIASCAAGALDYAHRKSDDKGQHRAIVHRDVSPPNILLSHRGDVKVTDFGIAYATNRRENTGVGVVKGKVGYMAPEQLRGEESDHRADIFALGSVLYQMITGKRAFIASQDFETLRNMHEAELPPLSQHRSGVPDELQRIVNKALATNPNERYPWASDLRRDLQAFLIDGSTIYTAENLAEWLKPWLEANTKGLEHDISGRYSAGANAQDTGGISNTERGPDFEASTDVTLQHELPEGIGGLPQADLLEPITDVTPEQEFTGNRRVRASTDKTVIVSSWPSPDAEPTDNNSEFPSPADTVRRTPFAKHRPLLLPIAGFMALLVLTLWIFKAGFGGHGAEPEPSVPQADPELRTGVPPTGHTPLSRPLPVETTALTRPLPTDPKAPAPPLSAENPSS